MAWSDYFTDPRLQQLIRIALENNRDLRVAALNVEKARAQFQIERAAIFPSVGAWPPPTVATARSLGSWVTPSLRG